MLHSLFPRAYRRFLSLPVLGPITDGFDDWLISNGYSVPSREDAIHMLAHLDAELRRRQVQAVGGLTHSVLHDCWRIFLQTYGRHGATVRTLGRYLSAKGLITEPATKGSPALTLIEEYANYLHEVRGLSLDTVSNHRYTAQCFLQHLKDEGIALKDLRHAHLESYITKAGRRLSRPTLRRDISALRGFLRFLSLDARIPDGLTRQIDTPRVYRLEQLPRTLPFETVRALLRCVDRTSAIGLRDYAVFLLIATYGLRSSDIVGITLDNIRWRQGILQIHQPKTLSPLDLPLTNEVMAAIVRHLRRTPPPSPFRQIFLRMRAPVGTLKPTAIADAFCSLVRKSGLSIPFKGAHCLRHSYAVHLLKNGTSLKTIGDILGHRSADSTSTYLRLATDDLREVALPVPRRHCRAKEGRQ